MATVSNVPIGIQPLDADDVTWTLPPFEPIERVDVLALTDADIFDYARDLQSECTILRTLLHQALTVAERTGRERNSYRDRLWRLVAEVREKRTRENRR